MAVGESPTEAAESGTRVALRWSLRLRILIIAVGFTTAISAALATFITLEFKDAVEESVLHEGVLFSDSLEASITEPTRRADYRAVQDQIDRMMAIRDENDVEVNVIILDGSSSEIVASNDPLNVEATDDEEHEALVASLEFDSPVVTIDVESADIDPDDDPTKRFDPTHPDYYFRPGVRFVSITTPLLDGQRKIGSINSKYSLKFLDETLDAIFWRTGAAMAFGLLLLSIGIASLLDRQLFRPLKRVTENILQFGLGRLAGDIPAAERRDEIGTLVKEFNGMVRRIRAAEGSLSAAARSLEDKNRMLEGLSRKLGKYLSPQVYQSIFSGRRTVELRTERKRLTIFFSDIVEFTQTTEELQPEDVTHLLNSYFAEMSLIALEHGATIDKFIGDAMLIFLGDPETKGVAEDAKTCVRMAIAMQRKMSDLQERWRREGYEKPFRMRVGVNTGYCNVGNFGSDDRMDYTIIGGAVNLAARLQAAANPGEIILSYETYALVRDEVTVEEREPIRVKGIGKPIRTYAIKPLEEAARQEAGAGPVGVSDIDLSRLSTMTKEEALEVLARITKQLEER
jgi:class 3 adenylate cyclase